MRKNSDINQSMWFKTSDGQLAGFSLPYFLTANITADTTNTSTTSNTPLSSLLLFWLLLLLCLGDTPQR